MLKTAVACLLIALLCTTASIASCTVRDTTPVTHSPTTTTSTVQVGRQQAHDGVTVTIGEISLSDEETLVLYKVDTADNSVPEGPLRSPTLEAGGEVLRSSAQNDIDGWKVISFHPLPAGTHDIVVNFNPFTQLNGPATDFTIDLGDKVGTELPTGSGLELEMDQVVEAAGAQFRVTTIRLYIDSFWITYKPETDEASSIMLLGTGPVAPGDLLTATDDFGNPYTVEDVNARLVFDSGYPQLKNQTIIFNRFLQPGTTRLDVKITATGTIGREPFRFEIQIP